MSASGVTSAAASSSSAESSCICASPERLAGPYTCSCVNTLSSARAMQSSRPPAVSARREPGPSSASTRRATPVKLSTSA